MTDKTTLDILRDAREIYAEAPSHAKLEERVAPGTYCAVTACYAAEPLEMSESTLFAVGDALELLHTATLDSDIKGIVDFNANHTTEEVLDLFNVAIEAAKRKR
jgi:hypothetical protein